MKALIVILFVAAEALIGLDFVFPAVCAGWVAVGIEHFTNINGRV